MRVRLAVAARRDLVEIAEYIAQDNPAAARSTARKLQNAALDLVAFPTKFAVIGILDGQQLRRRPCGNYSIFYVVGERHVEVVRILHSARDHERIFSPED